MQAEDEYKLSKHGYVSGRAPCTKEKYDVFVAKRNEEPTCPKCGNNRQVWTNQISGKKQCHRAWCNTVLDNTTKT